MDKAKHEKLVEHIVRDIFTALDEEDSVEEGGGGSEVELTRADLGDLTPEELEKALRDTQRFLQALWPLATEVVDNPVALMVLNDAMNRVEAAYEGVRKAR